MIHEDTIISVNNLSKKYRLGLFNQKSFIEDLQKIIQGNKFKEKSENYHLALNDFSLDINAGDSVALIGKNGSGKSTFLKLLSRITSPTSGSIKYKGRLVSVLEQGIGFHAELTAYDNIMLNGALLGCSHNFLKDNLKSIIEFAGINNFLDTPIKRYSSGMITRLGFAICAHIPSDILIVDEVLAVGDEEFRKKSIKLIENYILNQKKTLIFVSHELKLLKDICKRGIVLSSGNKVFDGNIDNAINFYTNQLA